MPRLRPGQTGAVTRTVGQFADFVVSFRSFSVYSPLSIGDQDQLTLFHDLTRDTISSSMQAPAMPLPNQEKLNQRKYAWLQAVGACLRPIILVLFFTAQLIALARLVQSIRRRQFTFPYVLAAAAWGGAFACLLLNALVQVTSFPVLAVSTFSPVYPLVLIFIIAAFWDAGEAWLGRRVT